jgi:regulator of sigma D
LYNVEQELEAARRRIVEFNEISRNYATKEDSYVDQIRSFKEMLEEKRVELEEARLRSDETAALKAQTDVQRETLIKLETANLQLKEVQAFLRNQLLHQESLSMETLHNVKQELEAARRRIVELNKISRNYATKEDSYVDQIRKFKAILEEKQVELLEEARLRSDETTALRAHIDVQRETMIELETANVRLEHLVREPHNREVHLNWTNMNIFIRVRPPIASEIRNYHHTESSPVFIFPRHTETFAIVEETAISSRPSKLTKFEVDHAFNPDDDQNRIWTGVEPLVQSAIEGFNVCVVAHGHTGMYCSLESSEICFGSSHADNFRSYLCFVLILGSGKT